MNINDFVAKCRSKEKFISEPKSRKWLRKSAEIVEEIVKNGVPAYGINTGLGFMRDKFITRNLVQLQKNIIKSHACGFGEPAPKKIAKGALLLLINSLSKGYSGIREKTFDTLVDLYNADIIPVIPSRGSVGASGDLAPMAHLALVLFGEGEALCDCSVITGKEALEKIGRRKPLELQPKEALSLINGTYLMTAYAAFAVWQAEVLLETANIITASTLEALRGTDKAFAEEIHFLKPHSGQIEIASKMRGYLKGSKIIAYYGEYKIQDPYCLRCAPQVHGAVSDAIKQAKKQIEIEINSVTDNPLVFPDGSVKSGGNFQGYYMALASDTLKIALAGLANISFQRIDHLMQAKHLPLFLALLPESDSEFMMPQVAAGSALTEIKMLAQPASIHNLSLSAGQEDFNSMGTIAARQAYELVEYLARILATEMLAVNLALDINSKDKRLSGQGVRILQEIIADKLPLRRLNLSEDLRKTEKLILDGEILKCFKQKTNDKKGE